MRRGTEINRNVALNVVKACHLSACWRAMLKTADLQNLEMLFMLSSRELVRF